MPDLKRFQHTYLFIFLILFLGIVILKGWQAHTGVVPGPVEIRAF